MAGPDTAIYGVPIREKKKRKHDFGRRYCLDGLQAGGKKVLGLFIRRVTDSAEAGPPGSAAEGMVRTGRQQYKGNLNTLTRFASY